MPADPEQLSRLQVDADLDDETCVPRNTLFRRHGGELTSPIARAFPGNSPARRGSVPAVLLTLTTTGKVTLLIVAVAFILWALITAIWIPKRNPDFPLSLTGFVLVSCVFFVLQMGAIFWVTGTQEVEKEAVAEAPVEEQPTETNAGDPQEGGDALVVAGKEVFLSAEAACGSCHTLADAGTEGSVGPNLDEVKPSAELVIDRVTNGKGVMPAYKGKLTEQQIEELAAYVSTVAGSS